VVAVGRRGVRATSSVVLAIALASCNAAAGSNPGNVGSSNGDGVVLESAAAPASETGTYNGPKPRPDVPSDCPLVIGFASYGAGIDRSALRTIEDLLARDPAVETVESHHWGREGEVTLCVRVRTKEDAERLFRLTRDAVPADPRAPVSVSTASGLNYRAPASPRSS
jgi:hypothetical protein